MPKKHSIRNSIRKVLDGKGYYMVLAVCILAVGVSALIFYRTLSGVPEADEPTAALSVPVTTQPPADSTPSPDTGKSADTTDTADTSADADNASVPTMAPSANSSSASNPSGASATVCAPVEGETIAVFSVDALAYNETMGDWRTHQGVDIATPLGTKVCAVMDGVVTAVYDDDYLGTVVTVAHDEGWSTLYANLTAVPAVSAGDQVRAGQVIGAVGQSAMLEVAAPPHLHLEVYRYGSLTDPSLLLD